jgi:hypothetical protein
MIAEIMDDKTIEVSKNRTSFSSKYQKSLKGAANFTVLELKNAHPDWSLTDILIEILKTTDTNVAPEYLSEYLQHAIEAWQRGTFKIDLPENVSVLVAA